MANAARDDNRVTTLIGVSSVDGVTPTRIAANPTTGAVIIDSTSLYAGLDPRYVNVTGDTMTGDFILYNNILHTKDYLLTVGGTASITGTNTGDITITDTNSVNLSLTGQAISADLVIQDTTSIDLAVDASGLKATVLPAGVDHNSLANLTTGDPHTQYLEVANNLSDLNNVATARTNLGLVAGGTGDIWVEKAGDTMTGSLAITGGSLTLNNASANRLYYGNIGVAGPSTSSAGQKIQLYGTAGTVNASDYAIGIEAGNIWVSAGTGGIKFYRSSGAK